MALYLNLESGASPNPTEEDIVQLVVIAKRVGVCTKANINGIDVLAFPNTDPERLVRNWRVALERGASFVAENVIPDPKGKPSDA